MPFYKIIVRCINGCDVWEEINARELEDETFEILDDPNYGLLEEYGVLFEFYPGDIVQGGFEIIPPGDYYEALALIKAGNFENRKYYEFKFKAATQTLQMNSKTLEEYSSEIYRINSEIAGGKFNYMHVRLAIQRFTSKKI